MRQHRMLAITPQHSVRRRACRGRLRLLHCRWRLRRSSSTHTRRMGVEAITSRGKADEHLEVRDGMLRALWQCPERSHMLRAGEELEERAPGAMDSCSRCDRRRVRRATFCEEAAIARMFGADRLGHSAA